MIAVNTNDAKRFNSFSNTEPLTSDRLGMLPWPSTPSPDTRRIPNQPHLAERVRASDADCGKLSEDQKAEPMATLAWFIKKGLFPTALKREKTLEWMVS